MRTPRDRGRMPRPSLLLLNVLLFGALAMVSRGPSADAQLRPPGRYTATPGGVNGSEADAVWIVDTVNREMIALTWDPNEKQVKGIGYRNLASDVRSVLTDPGR